MKSPLFTLLGAALLTLAASAALADVTVTPAAGESFRVNGPVVLPAVPGAGTQAQAVCISAQGQLGPCSAGGGGTYTAGTGLAVSPGGQFSIAPGYQLPQGCTSSQAIQWNGSAWVCVSPASTGSLPACQLGEVLRFGTGGLECGATPHLTTPVTVGGDFTEDAPYISAILSDNGLPIISAYFRDGAGTGRLIVRTCMVPNCSTYVGYYLAHAADVGRRNSMALLPGGLPVISYRNTSDNSVEVVRCANPYCTLFHAIQTVESNVGDGPTSIAIGADGMPRVAYYDSVTGRLRFARCTDEQCGGKVIATVASGAGVGTYHGVAVPADGLPVISYNDAGDLKAAKCNNANCTAPTVTTVDAAGTAGLYNRIAISRDGLPVIAYADGTNTTLKVAHCTDQACGSATLTTVDSGTSLGLQTGLFIGPSGPVISHNAPQSGLRVVTCHDDACTSATANDLGVRSSNQTAIVVGNDGLPVVAYSIVGTEGYHITQCSSATCRQP